MWILKRVFLPRQLRPSEIETFAAFLNTLIPDGEFPGAQRTGLLERLLAECEAQRQTRHALLEGIELLEYKARQRGGMPFASLPSDERERLVDECAQADDGTVPRFFYRVVRDRAMQLHYADPAVWQPFGPPHPPQPEGYPAYWQKPNV